jgi:hypothetical protein
MPHILPYVPQDYAEDHRIQLSEMAGVSRETAS